MIYEVESVVAASYQVGEDCQQEEGTVAKDVQQPLIQARVNLIGRLLTDMIMKAFNLWYQHDVSNTLVSPDELYAHRYW